MARAGRHLHDMVDSVVDFASIESEKTELHLAPIAVEELIKECVDIIRPIAAGRALSLLVEIGPGAPRGIVCDAARLRQILINLLGNAIKFTREGGVELRVRAGSSPGGLRIEVADTGPGIDLAHHDYQSQEFGWIDDSAAVEGTGPDLAITARVVALMGGTISHAANPGGGSVFCLELPHAECAEASPPPRAGKETLARGRRLLLVDDGEMTLELMVAYLRSGDHVVTVACDGREAIRLASDTMFDLVLMDECMPDLDGLEVTRRIRELPAPHGQVPILALTAQSVADQRAFADQRARSQSAGVDAYVTKPVDHAMLMRAITETTSRAARQVREDTPIVRPIPIRQEPPPRMDRAALDETLAFLSNGEITGHYRLLRARQEQMVRLLDLPDDPALLTEAADVLASTAGMFGFKALAAVARQFENAMADDFPTHPRLADEVRAETQAALAILADLARETRTQMG